MFNSYLYATAIIASVLMLTELQNDRLIKLLEEFVKWISTSPLVATIGVLLLLVLQATNAKLLRSRIAENTDVTKDVRENQKEAKVALDFALASAKDKEHNSTMGEEANPIHTVVHKPEE